MSSAGAGKNRKLELVRGDLYGKPRGLRKRKGAAMDFTTAEMKLEDAMHTAFCQLNAPDGTVPSEGVQMIRERRQWPWRVLGRRIREAIEADVPESKLYEITHELNRYIAFKAEQRRSTEKRRA